MQKSLTSIGALNQTQVTSSLESREAKRLISFKNALWEIEN